MTWTIPPFVRSADGVRKHRYVPTRDGLHDAVAFVRDREKEVTLEMALGTRPPRVGMWWGWVPGRTRTAHFFIEVKWKAIGARADTEPFDVRLESACMRWDLDRYAKDDRPARRIEDLTTWKQVCRRCAFEVQQEDA